MKNQSTKNTKITNKLMNGFSAVFTHWKKQSSDVCAFEYFVPFVFFVDQ
jgi:hypothetical protein